MAVPFAFPEENDDVEVIIRQLGLLLNRLTVEFKKQRNENIQLRAARIKMQSNVRRQTAALQGSQECTNCAQSSMSANRVGDTLLSAIATCKRFALLDRRVATTSRRECNNDSKNEDDAAGSLDKTEIHRTDSSSDITEMEDQTSLSFIRLRLQPHRFWSWLAPSTLTSNPFWTTAVICVVGWHLLR